MTHELLFDIVTFGSFVLPLCLALIVAALPRPKSPLVRALVAIVTAWVASVMYTIYLYNPAGIAAGHELGWDSPELRFDNNTVASQLVGGWIHPAIIVVLFFAARYAWRRRKANGSPMSTPSNKRFKRDARKAARPLS